MPRRRKSQIQRQAPSSEDPVGDELAVAGDVTSRHPDDTLDTDELRTIIAVQGIDPHRYGGFNTVVEFFDECSSYAVMEDGIELALAEQPGIDELSHPDRETMLIRTTLALPDVHAAAIRALLEVNRRPRDLPPVGLSRALLSDVAEGMLTALNWPGRLRMARAEDGRYHEPPPGPLDGWHGCYRLCAPRLLQVVHLWYGLGELGDGTRLDGTVTADLRVWDIATEAAEASIQDARGREFPQGMVVAEKRVYAVRPTVDDVVQSVRAALQWFDTVSTRESIVDSWIRQPAGQAPYPLWEKIETAARWGLRDAALALLRHGHRHEPQHAPKFDAIARKYGL